jgi:hypothetical protein
VKFRHKVIEVEAEQWFPGKEIPGVKIWPECLGPTPYVTTMQGQQVTIKAGEWIIQEGDGIHAYPCDPGRFEQIYEPVEESGWNLRLPL